VHEALGRGRRTPPPNSNRQCGGPVETYEPKEGTAGGHRGPIGGCYYADAAGDPSYLFDQVWTPPGSCLCHRRRRSEPPRATSIRPMTTTIGQTPHPKGAIH